MALLTVKVQETRNSVPPCDTVERTVALPLPAEGDCVAAVFAAAAPSGLCGDVSFCVDNLRLLAPDVAVGRHANERARRARERGATAEAHGRDGAALNLLVDTALTLCVADGANGYARGGHAPFARLGAPPVRHYLFCAEAHAVQANATNSRLRATPSPSRLQLGVLPSAGA
jgi:hypothetical protein